MKVFADYACFGHWTLAARINGLDIVAVAQPGVYDFYTYKESYQIHKANFGTFAWASMLKKDQDGGYPEAQIQNLKADLMVGSPPCVGVSGANPNSGPDHPANKNFANFFRDVSLVQPETFLVEICEGIFTKGESTLKRAMGYVKNYNLEYGLYDVEQHGSPSVRRRPYFLGSRRVGKPTLKEALALPQEKEIGCSTVLDDIRRKWDRYEPDNHMLMSRFLADGKTPRNGPFRTLTDHKRTLDPKRPAPTVTGFSCESAFHYSHGVEGERLIAVPEVKRLMGFPDTFKLNTEHGNWNAVKYCKVIASGVQIGFTTKLLRRVLKFI